MFFFLYLFILFLNFCFDFFAGYFPEIKYCCLGFPHYGDFIVHFPDLYHHEDALYKKILKKEQISI